MTSTSITTNSINFIDAHESTPVIHDVNLEVYDLSSYLSSNILLRGSFKALMAYKLGNMCFLHWEFTLQSRLIQHSVIYASETLPSEICPPRPVFAFSDGTAFDILSVSIRDNKRLAVNQYIKDTTASDTDNPNELVRGNTWYPLI